jgi:hypothetical protein
MQGRPRHGAILAASECTPTPPRLSNDLRISHGSWGYSRTKQANPAVQAAAAGRDAAGELTHERAAASAGGQRGRPARAAGGNCVSGGRP